ncbi:MAG: hypothetical protein ABI402_12800 [Ferruginibacter sp.]
MTRLKRLIRPKFVLHYFALTLLFLLLFHFLKFYYINDYHKTRYSIDEYVLRTCDFFNSQYVITAKYVGYDHARYYITFFVMDMIFPLIYTCMFLSTVSGLKKNWMHVLFLISIFAGCLFDYLEDFSFAVFLSVRGDELAPAVAFFTTIKSFLYVVNMIICFGCLLLYYREANKSLKGSIKKKRH